MLNDSLVNYNTLLLRISKTYEKLKYLQMICIKCIATFRYFVQLGFNYQKSEKIKIRVTMI